MNLFDEESSELNITPLVDVFLILMSIFVMFSILYFHNQTFKEKIEIPSSKSSIKTETKKIKYVYLFIYKDNSIVFEKKKFKSLNNFKKYIIKYKPLKIKTNYSIIADKNIIYNNVIEILDIFKENNIENVSLELKTKR
jgi:biopolymer transport protein ExbD